MAITGSKIAQALFFELWNLVIFFLLFKNSTLSIDRSGVNTCELHSELSIGR